MEKIKKIEQIEKDLEELCVSIHNRHVGSKGNQRAIEYVAKRLKGHGFSISKPEFQCIDWEYGDVVLKVGEEKIKSFISPYSISCEVKGEFETVGSIEELCNKKLTGKIAVLHGELSKEQIMPKSFTFYNPEEHKKIIKILEDKRPLAIVAITTKNPQMTGGWYPFPLFEDGDFDIPSVYLTDKEGERILSNTDSSMSLLIESNRIPSYGNNIIATKKGKSPKRIVFSAHIDTKKETPGALDNGGGVAILLALAELLENYEEKYTIELAVLNGEDYYSNPGQKLYIEQNKEAFDKILININTDGAGYRDDKTTFCKFNCEGWLEDAIQAVFNKEEFIEVEPWYQSDHMIFVMNNKPAVAITSESIWDIVADIAHTSKDTIELVNVRTILDIAYTMKELVVKINEKE